MTTDTKILLKKITDLEIEINSGKTAWAAGVNHGSAYVSLIAPGQYECTLDSIAGERRFISDKDEYHDTLQQFLDTLQWDLSDDLTTELQGYLSRRVWHVGEDLGAWQDLDMFEWTDGLPGLPQEVVAAARWDEGVALAKKVGISEKYVPNLINLVIEAHAERNRAK